MDYIMIITDVRVDHEYKQILIADCVLWVPEGAYTRLASLDSMFLIFCCMKWGPYVTFVKNNQN